MILLGLLCALVVEAEVSAKADLEEDEGVVVVRWGPLALRRRR